VLDSMQPMATHNAQNLFNDFSGMKISRPPL